MGFLVQLQLTRVTVVSPTADSSRERVGFPRGSLPFFIWPAFFTHVPPSQFPHLISMGMYNIKSLCYRLPLLFYEVYFLCRLARGLGFADGDDKDSIVLWNRLSPFCFVIFLLFKGAFTNRSRGPYGEQKLLFESYICTHRTGPGNDL